MTHEQQELNEVAESIIGMSFKVANQLGRGFVESVYENALVHEISRSHQVKQQEPLLVRYDGVIVGEFRVDLVVDELVLVEVKAVLETSNAHEAQLINYLKAGKRKLGLLINFGGPSVKVTRKVNGY